MPRRNLEETVAQKVVESAIRNTFRKRSIRPSEYLNGKLYSLKSHAPGKFTTETYQKIVGEISKRLGINYNAESDSLPTNYQALVKHLKRKVKNRNKTKDYQVIGELRLEDMDEVINKKEYDELSPENNPHLAKYFDALFRTPASPDYQHYQ